MNSGSVGPPGAYGGTGSAADQVGWGTAGGARSSMEGASKYAGPGRPGAGKAVGPAVAGLRGAGGTGLPRGVPGPATEPAAPWWTTRALLSAPAAGACPVTGPGSAWAGPVPVADLSVTAGRAPAPVGSSSARAVLASVRRWPASACPGLAAARMALASVRS
ncbi:hypothetical protein [Micromonospora olivasterospora]|uniref:Uncharacterized protein n=1 Tax=Micromonospora olivasterospora TaxID=1880 RepID=A0A562I6E2_MICOL|nr:hypothetical protein [Micromonospora olivasterospora]TWH66590.1 hypothetical protein JD77_01544 [Micromonospora olivasterospora]